MADTTSARPWLAELLAKYGPSGISPDPVRLREDGCFYDRQAWVWEVDSNSHHLAIDQFTSHLVVRAHTPSRFVSVAFFDPDGPAADEVRAVLVLAGMLEASP